MRYPHFYEMYKNAIKNTWTVEEVDFSIDVIDLRSKMTPAERHMINRLVAFFATGDSIVSNNLVLNLYKHINAPEARMYLRVSFTKRRFTSSFILHCSTRTFPIMPNAKRFCGGRKYPVDQKKGRVLSEMDRLDQRTRKSGSKEDRRRFLLNLICFAACIEGLFFFAAFAYVYFLRSKGLLHGLASGTNWVFRDESCHMRFRVRGGRTGSQGGARLFRRRARTPDRRQCSTKQSSARLQFAEDILSGGVPGLSVATCGNISNSSPTSASRCLVCKRSTARKTRSPSWTCRTFRNWPTSSNAASRPTR